MPRKSKIEQLGIGTDVVSARINGNTYEEIAQTHGLSIDQVQRFLRKQNKTKLIPKIEQIKLELSQDNAQSQFMRYIAELNRRYNRVKDSDDLPDRQEATAILRLIDSAIDKYMRVTGLYDKARKEAEREEDVRVEIIVRRE